MFKQLENVLFEYKNGRVIAVPGKYVTRIEMDISNSYISKFNEELVQRAFYVNSAEFSVLEEFLDNPIIDVCGNEVNPHHIQNPIKDVTLVYADGEEELYIMTSGDIGFIVLTFGPEPIAQQERDSKQTLKRLAQLSDAELTKNLECMSVSEIEWLVRHILSDHDIYSHISCHPHSLLLIDLLQHRAKVMNNDFVWTQEKRNQLYSVEKMLWDAFQNTKREVTEFLKLSPLVDAEELHIRLFPHIKEETQSKYSFRNLLSEYDNFIVVPAENDDYWLDEYSNDYYLMGVNTSAIFEPLERTQCFSVQDILDIETVDVRVQYNKIYKALPKEIDIANEDSKVYRINCDNERRTIISDKACIGPFFYINNELIAHTIPVEQGEVRGNRVDNPYSHEQLYDYNFNSGDYIDVPRGRVVWDLKNNEAIILIDRCIETTKIEIEIVLHFGLDDYRIDYDEHYVCPNCMGDIWGDD